MAGIDTLGDYIAVLVLVVVPVWLIVFFVSRTVAYIVGGLVLLGAAIAAARYIPVPEGLAAETQKVYESFPTWAWILLAAAVAALILTLAVRRLGWSPSFSPGAYFAPGHFIGRTILIGVGLALFLVLAPIVLLPDLVAPYGAYLIPALVLVGLLALALSISASSNQTLASAGAWAIAAVAVLATLVFWPVISDGAKWVYWNPDKVPPFVNYLVHGSGFNERYEYAKQNGIPEGGSYPPGPTVISLGLPGNAAAGAYTLIQVAQGKAFKLDAPSGYFICWGSNQVGDVVEVVHAAADNRSTFKGLRAGVFTAVTDTVLGRCGRT